MNKPDIKGYAVVVLPGVKEEPRIWSIPDSNIRKEDFNCVEHFTETQDSHECWKVSVLAQSKKEAEMLARIIVEHYRFIKERKNNVDGEQ